MSAENDDTQPVKPPVVKKAAVAAETPRPLKPEPEMRIARQSTVDALNGEVGTRNTERGTPAE